MRIAVLISGGGTTLRNLIDYRKSGKLSVEIAHVLSNNPKAKGLDFGKDAGIETSVVNHREFDSTEHFSREVYRVIETSGADLVVMGGFLRKLLIPDEYTNRVINIHPSLIPSFCGHGFYGKKVHQGVLDYGCKVTGCTVHFVDNQYDHGPIIAQQAVAVMPGDDANTLAARVFQSECELYPKVIQAIADQKIEVSGRNVIWKAAQ